jgi:hypothetical protein
VALPLPWPQSVPPFCRMRVQIRVWPFSRHLCALVPNRRLRLRKLNCSNTDRVYIRHTINILILPLKTAINLSQDMIATLLYQPFNNTLSLPFFIFRHVAAFSNFSTNSGNNLYNGCSVVSVFVRNSALATVATIASTIAHAGNNQGADSITP